MSFSSSMRGCAGLKQRVSIIAIIAMFFSLIPFTPAQAVGGYTLTLTISPTHVTQTQDVTITVESTTALDGPPSIVIEKPDETTVSVGATQQSDTTWTATYPVEASTTPNGTYNLTVTGTIGSVEAITTSSFDVAMGTIEGTVYDGTAETTVALESCEVQLYDQASKSPPISYAFTGGSGNKYRFTGLAPGDYWVQAPRSGTLPLKAASAKTKVVVSENTTSTAGLALRNPSLTGTVVDPNGNPVSSVRVEAHNKDWTESVEDFTDADGHFALAPVTSDTYGIVARPQLDSGFANSETKVISLSSATQALSDPLELRQIMITGQVLPPTGSTGVSDVGVMIHNENWSYQEESFTDDDGYFYFGAITAGSYKVEAFPGPGSAYCQATPTDVTITGETQTIAAIRLSLPSIIGTVVNPDESGTPASGAFVEVHNSDWSICMGTQVNNEETGEYQIGGLPAGTYKIRANPGQSSPYSCSVEQTVTVSSESAQTINMTLTSPTIVGKVVDGDSNAVRNANVVLHTSNWQTVYFSQPTGNNGRFALGGIAAGTYQLEINPPWERPDLIRPDALTVEVSADSTYTITGGACTTTTVGGLPAIQVAFAKASKTIEGAVTKTGGSPIKNAQVFAFKEQGCGFANTTTNSDGTYSLGVSGGKWKVSIEPNKESTTTIDWAYTGQPRPVTFSESSTPETSTVNFEVTAASAIVIGRVLAPDETTTVQQAHVELRSANGQGSGGQPNENGEFSINVPAGTYQLMTFLPPDSPYGSSSPQAITTNESGTIDVGDIILTSKNCQIKGIVRGPSGQGVSDAAINAMQPRGGFTQTTTGSDGTFTLNVSPGTWEVMLEPTSEASYVYSGPPVRVTVGNSEIKTGVSFSVVYADSTIQGRVVDGNGDTMTDLYGFACASTDNGGYGGPLEAGRFELSVPAGTYDIGGGFPPGTPYSLSSANDTSVATGETKVVELTVVENDRTISGVILDSNGDTVTADSLFVEVFAMNGTGTFQHAVAEKNGVTGAWEYSLSVSDGEWRIGYFVDKDSGYLGRPPVDEDSAVTVDGNETYDITLYSASATISGRVTNPDGNGLPYVFVFAQEPKDNNGSGRSRFFTDTMTDANGYYTLGVPAGSYQVGSGMPPSKMKTSAYVYPELKNITVADSETETVNIQYGSADSALAGSVTLGGSGVDALVWAWSENGRYAETDASDDGSYTIPVKGDETWHVGAKYKDGDGFYIADETEVDVSASSTETVNLALKTSTASVPDAVSITFSSGEMKIIELSNGTKIQIPAGALASSGNVSVMAQPEVGLRKQKDAQPVGIGYELTALDSNGQEISDFISAVTITFPYDPNDLPEGTTADDLVPAYWDDNSGTWQKVDSAVIDAENHTITVQVTHFSLWGNISKSSASTSDDQQDDTSDNPGGGGSGSVSISAPTGLNAIAVPSAKTISVSWDASNGTNLDGYYLYRSLTDKVADAVKLATIAKGTTTYSDSAITDGKTYYYWISAYDTSNQESSKSGPASAVAGQIEVSFTDLLDTHWAKQYISTLVSKGIIAGYSDKTFRPSKTVTRAEFAKMVCLAKGWQLTNPATASFSDVAKTDWSYSYIETVKANGAIDGYKDGSFRPGNQITRAEIAKIMATAQGLTSGASNLIDIDDSWAKAYINACVQAGIVSGYGNGTFKPGANATRAEAAKMIYAIVQQ
jgi:hypothetical protein